MRQTLHETVQFRVPTGFKAAVAEIAAREHLTPSCYLRRLALMHVEGRRGHSADADGSRRRKGERCARRPHKGG
jgi:hypothetical protein